MRIVDGKRIIKRGDETCSLLILSVVPSKCSIRKTCIEIIEGHTSSCKYYDGLGFTKSGDVVDAPIRCNLPNSSRFIRDDN